MGAYRAVIVGTDGSGSSLRAVDKAAALAQATGATLVLASAYRPLDDREHQRASRALGDEVYKVTGAHPAEDALREAEARARAAGASSITAEAVEGEPVDVLVGLGEKYDADLIVVGNRGLNSLAGRLLGSVPANISHRAKADVLIVHTTAGR